MYGFITYTPLDVEEILKRISQEDIFEIVFKEGVDLDRKYKAPYRNDNEAGCWFHYYEDILYFTDFADKEVNKTCFRLLQIIYNISFIESLELINSHFSLNLGVSTSEPKKVVYEPKISFNNFNINVSKEPKKILCYIRDYNKKDLEFWGQYGITKNQLLEDKVYAIEGYSSTNKKGEVFTISLFNELAYAYTDFDDNKIKIYRPFANKEGKWFTNCNNNNIGNKNNVMFKDKLIITKSYKDCRVLRNLGLDSIWLQNEGQIPNITVFKDILTKYKEIYIWFDNDSTGMGSAKILRDNINNNCSEFDLIVNTFLIPPILLKSHNVKDPSDYYKVFGRESLIEFIKSKINN